MLIAPQTLPSGSTTGAAIEPTPGSRWARLWAQPRSRTRARSASVNAAPLRSAGRSSAQAASTWAADPAFIVSAASIGTVSRRPATGSAAAMHMRWSPTRRYTWALSPVRSRRSLTISSAARRSGSIRAPHRASLLPSTKRPWPSRSIRPWCSRASAIRCAVGRGSPVAATSSFSLMGSRCRQDKIATALSRTPTPLYSSTK